MTQIFLMDLKGLPRLINNQPSVACDPMECAAWLSVFTTVCNIPEGKELRVRFRDNHNNMVTAHIIGSRDNLIDILPEGDMNLYMYARDIIPDKKTL